MVCTNEINTIEGRRKEEEKENETLAYILQQGLEFGAFNGTGSTATSHWKNFPELKINIDLELVSCMFPCIAPESPQGMPNCNSILSDIHCGWVKHCIQLHYWGRGQTYSHSVLLGFTSAYSKCRSVITSWRSSCQHYFYMHQKEAADHLPSFGTCAPFTCTTICQSCHF